MNLENKICVFIFLAFLLASILLTPLAFATAPSWVTKGVNVNYTLGTSTVSYSVTDKIGDALKLDLKTISSSGSITPGGKPTDNASADYSSNHFWFDPILLKDLFSGATISGFLFNGESTFSAAGKEWAIVHLEGTIDGAKVDKLIDKETGLTIKQTVTPPGMSAQTITLKNYNIPSWVSSTPPSSSPSSIPPAPDPSPNPSPSGTPSPTPSLIPLPTPAPSNQPYEPASTAPLSINPPSSNVPCCPVAFVLLPLALFAARKN